MPPTLVIRADATTEIGTGHVMRCLALAQAWQDRGGDVIFAAHPLPSATAQLLTANSITVETILALLGSSDDTSALLDVCDRRAADWVCVDGYHFGAEYQRGIKRAGRKLLFVDDYGHAKEYVSDLVLNQNVYARDDCYQARSAYTRLLMGSEYALLRREFRRWRDWRRVIAPEVRKMLVTFGGSDLANVTPRAIAAIGALSQTHNAEAKVLVGAANPRREEIAKQVRTTSRVELLHAADDMPALIAWADLAISAAGSTSWEYCALGLPSTLVVTAENQEPLATRLGQLGAALNMGWQQGVTAESLCEAVRELSAASDRRVQMSRAARSLVDGMGADRVVDAMRGAS